MTAFKPWNLRLIVLSICNLKCKSRFQCTTGCFLRQIVNIAQKMQDLLHWDAKLDGVRRQLFPWPHQSKEPFRSEDSKLRVAQLIERMPGMTWQYLLDHNRCYRHGDIFIILTNNKSPEQRIIIRRVITCFIHHHCLGLIKDPIIAGMEF